MKSLLKNYLYNLLLTLAGFLFPFVVFVYVSRILGPGGLGKVNFASTIADYFILFGLFGMNSYGVREIARARDDGARLKATFNELFKLNCATIGLSLAAYIAFVFLNPRMRAEPLLYLANGTSVFLALFSFDWLFQGLENYRYITIRSIATKALTVALVFLFVKRQGDYVLYAFISILGFGANNLFNLYYANKLVGIDFRGARISRHFPAIARFALIAVATSLYVGMDKLFLGYISGDYYVGLYSPADKIAHLALTLVSALTTILFPRLSNLFARGNREETSSLIENSLHGVMLIAIPAFLGIELLAAPIVLVTSGREFAASILTLRIEALIIPAVSVASIAGVQVLVGSGKEGKYLISIVAGAAAFVASAALLVPGLRQNGAAISLVAAECAGAVVSAVFARGELRRALKPSWAWRIAAASAAMVALLLLLERFPLSNLNLLLVAVPAGACLYFLALALLKDSIVVAVAAQCRAFLGSRKRGAKP